jgi:hypothetical protein
MAAPIELARDGRRLSWRLLRGTAAGLVLALPWAAMHYTDAGVNWTGSDFVVFATMLGLAVGGYELATLGVRPAAYRAAAALALATAFALVWISLAVGMMGPESNPANRMYGGVLAVGILGALLARGGAPGMAGALLATGLAHAAVALVAVLDGWAYTLIPNAVFVALWLVSARLFQIAGRESPARHAGT